MPEERTPTNVDANLAPHNLNDFVGQTAIKQALRIAITAARTRGEAMGHVLLIGPPDIGKRTLAKIIAQELQVGLMTASADVIRKPVDLTGILSNVRFRQVLLIDAVDELPPAVQQMLSSTLVDNNVDVVVGTGPNARQHRLPLPRFTLVGTSSTSPGKGLATESFALILPFVEYTLAELTEVVIRSAKVMQIDIETQAAAETARRANGVPGSVRRLLQKLRDYSQVHANGRITSEVVFKAFDSTRTESVSQRRQPVQIEATTTSGHPPIDDTGTSVIMQELLALTGLEKVKAEVASLSNFIRISQLRRQSGLAVSPISLHLVFTGNPGTGKTTVARLLARIYQSLGVLTKGHLIEVDRSGLVAGYLGQTALKTGEVIQRAMDGILFIDEAYALVTSQEDFFGREAIDTLLKAMEDNRDRLVVIVAGYTEPMKKFLQSNPGLESRFNKFIDFQDYQLEELFTILKQMLNKTGYHAGEDALAVLKLRLAQLSASGQKNFANVRAVRNLFERVQQAQADRLASARKSLTRDDLMTIEVMDVEGL